MPNGADSGAPNRASYTTNADGTVTDNVTGFLWEGSPDPGSFSQPAAVSYCAGKAPLGTWHLPGRLELVSIVDPTVAVPGPTINTTVFKYAYNTSYWTSLTMGKFGWWVNFLNAMTDFNNDLTASRKARCVRTPPPKCYPTRYTVKTGGFVTDNATGLTWQQTAMTGISTYANASAYCSGLADGGFRVPTVNEGQTIFADDGTADATAFPGLSGGALWTSSILSGSNQYLVVFSNRADQSGNIEPHAVLCVRWH
jgi:hypothetical protein